MGCRSRLVPWLLAAAACLPLSANAVEPADLAPLFPFKVTHGLPDNITNVQTWQGPWRPAGADGFVRAEQARFVTDRGPCRFTGTNICFSGCFPEHEQAERVAADLARFGINLVRLHYVHHQWPPERRYASPDSFIEPVQLERFDYLFNQLKQRGIYIYFQLNIARKFGAAAGFEQADKLPWYNNGLDNFEPRMLALQRKYLHDLLGHVNPYTGLAYRDEPAIAALELANENSVVAKWYSGSLDNLPEPYAAQFQGLWNDWLKQRHGTTVALREAWGCRTVPVGDELIADGGFAAQPADAAMADCHEQEQQPGSPSASPDCAHCAACALASALPIPAADAASPAPAAHRYPPHPAAAFSAFGPDGPERPPRPDLI